MIPHSKVALLLVCLQACTSQISEAKRVSEGRVTTLTHNSITVNSSATDPGQADEPAFFLVQLADPQLGMLKMCADTVEDAKDFQDELDNLRTAVDQIKKLEPGLVVMSGDMQNFYSGDLTKNFKLGPESGLGDYGDVQAKAVKDVMDELQFAGINVFYTPGNHDLDDTLEMKHLQRYNRLWGPDHYSFWVAEDGKTVLPHKEYVKRGLVKGVFFISINSQFYFEEAVDADVQRYRQEQSQWIERRIRDVQALNPTAIVVLTHIPPFIGSLDERHGWANWHETFRSGILGTLMDDDVAVSPELWLCGHFHGNVVSRAQLNGKPIEIVTTGSVGSTMSWDNNQEKAFESSHASQIARCPTGSEAFTEHIIAGNFSNIGKRISTSSDLSGVRIVQFFTNGKYRHKWFTLEEFGSVSSIDDAFT